MTPAAPFRLTSRATSIALVAGLHAAFIAVLLMDSARRPVMPANPARAFLLVPVRPAEPAEPPPERPREPRAAPRRAAALVLPPSPPSPALPTALPPARADAIAAPPPSQPAITVLPDPFAIPAAPASLAERARRSAAKIARDLGADAGPAATPGTLAAQRDTFNKHFDRPFQGGLHGFTVDRTVSPDGTSVTRRSSGGRASCYIAEPYQLRTITRSSSAEKRVNCPPEDAGWERR